MSLFSFKDIQIPTTGEIDKALGSEVNLGHPVFLSDDKLHTIKSAIGDLENEQSIFFMTDGAWSNIQLIEYILMHTGPANIFFTTWSIAADTIRCLHAWKDSGLILESVVLLDQGIRNRKPEILQQAQSAFKNLKLCKCHAKVTVIQNAEFSITLMGSANFTRNPRKEVGMIIQNRALANENIKWILEEFER